MKRCSLVLLLAAGAALAQIGEISFPAANGVISGDGLLIANNTSRTIHPLQVAQVEFQYSSSPTGPWARIGTTLGPHTGTEREYRSIWDTVAVSSGIYYVRAKFILLNGLILPTPAISVTVNKVPVAVATAQEIAPNTIRFDGSASQDPDGSIVRYAWDFGDGTTGAGPIVTHFYADLSQGYVAGLLITDNRGGTATAYVPAHFEQPLSCICTQINLVTTGTVKGKDASGSGYPPRNGKDDGKTLGKLHNNPGNAAIGGEKRETGFAFEIQGKVQGVPGMCKEIQLARGNYVTPAGRFTEAECTNRRGRFNADGTCTFPSYWSGKTNDFDGDGMDDLDVSTEAKCTALKGKWNATKATCENAAFYAEANGPYKPDEPDSGTFAYRRPYEFKAHVGQDVFWWDAPSYGDGAPNGVKTKLDFVAILLGQDAKYCYVDFTVETERKVGEDVETITQNKNENRVDKARVTGLK